MIIFASRTGNVRWITDKVSVTSGINCVDMKDVYGEISQPFLLMTYTDALGEAPGEVLQFLEQNHTYCKGAIASGNNNFGHRLFCRSIDIIEQRFGIPALHRIDLRGQDADIERIVQLYRERVQNG